jgi:hypothetical protein
MHGQVRPEDDLRMYGVVVRSNVVTVEDSVIEERDKTKVRVIVSEANVQTPEVATTAPGKATYASVLRQPGHACANTAVKWKSEFTDECSHSIG